MVSSLPPTPIPISHPLMRHICFIQTRKTCALCVSPTRCVHTIKHAEDERTPHPPSIYLHPLMRHICFNISMCRTCALCVSPARCPHQIRRGANPSHPLIHHVCFPYINTSRFHMLCVTLRTSNTQESLTSSLFIYHFLVLTKLLQTFRKSTMHSLPTNGVMRSSCTCIIRQRGSHDTYLFCCDSSCYYINKVE